MIIPIQHPSPNHDERDGSRVTTLVLHYTGMQTGEAALQRLSDSASRVSSHYLVEEDGRVFQLVDESLRAWHAGVSSWAGVHGLNSVSVGVEIVNPGHEYGYRAFPEAQMLAVETLASEIVARHIIAKTHVVGHSDIAPMRKDDPGELFDWDRLAVAGLCVAKPVITFDASEITLIKGDEGASVALLQTGLQKIGYGININGSFDDMTEAVVRAFQRRFRRDLISNTADAETRALIAALGVWVY